MLCVGVFKSTSFSLVLKIIQNAEYTRYHSGVLSRTIVLIYQSGHTLLQASLFCLLHLSLIYDISFLFRVMCMVKFFREFPHFPNVDHYYDVQKNSRAIHCFKLHVP